MTQIAPNLSCESCLEGDARRKEICAVLHTLYMLNTSHAQEVDDQPWIFHEDTR